MYCGFVKLRLRSLVRIHSQKPDSSEKRTRNVEGRHLNFLVSFLANFLGEALHLLELSPPKTNFPFVTSQSNKSCRSTNMVAFGTGFRVSRRCSLVEFKGFWIVLNDIVWGFGFQMVFCLFLVFLSNDPTYKDLKTKQRRPLKRTSRLCMDLERFQT